MERLFLIDGMAIAYRAYFAFINRPLINSKGMNTSAAYGFVGTLEKILKEENPEHIAVAFDTPEPTFRHKSFADYKATREKMPEDMIEQLPWIKRIVEAYNIPILELPGWEADDIIGTLAKRSESENMECYLVTGDKDFMQLVTDRIKLYRPGKTTEGYEVVDINGVKEKFGVRPDQVIEVLGLIGDTSDNVPGVRGVGEKTAIPLIQEYGSISGLYENIEKLSKKALKEKLVQSKELAFLSRELVTIDTNAPIDIDPASLQRSPKDFATLREIFSELEMTRLLKELNESEAATSPAISVQQREAFTDEDPPHWYVIVRTHEALEAMVRELLKNDAFAFHIESSGSSPLLADVTGLAFAAYPRHAWFIPMNDRLHSEEIIAAISRLFQTERMIVGEKLKFDLSIMQRYGIETAQPLFDTTLAAYILRPEGNHTRDALAALYLHEETQKHDAPESGLSELRDADETLQTFAEPADFALRLAQALRPEIERTGQQKLLDEIEFPLIHVLTDMECTGVKIDVGVLEEISLEMEKTIDMATGRIYEHAGEIFNIASTKQLGVILFEKLRLPKGKKTKTGYSTDVSVLESLQGIHPIIDEILLYRQLTKLKSTYVDALPKMVNPKTGRVHTTYNQAVAATGRLSSTDPNLQNIPIRTEAGREIRKAFVPGSKDFVLLSADYSQIELRLAAEISGDEGMIEAFRSGEDIHMTTAMKLFDVPASEVTPDMRRQAKTTNFGILYGISAFGLAQRLGTSNADAKDLIDLYFSKYPKINLYVANTIAFAKKHGYVETLMGRRRYIPEINSKNRNVRMFGERMAINAPIQGSAADMIKIAMIDIHREMKRSKLQSLMILQVHDELVFEAHRDELDTMKPLVIEHMKRAMNVSIPIEVEAGVGENWLEAH